MRQIKSTPLAVIKGKCAGRYEIARFLEVADESEILRRIVGVPKMETPAKIQKQPLPSGPLHRFIVRLTQRRFKKWLRSLRRNLHCSSHRY